MDGVSGFLSEALASLARRPHHFWDLTKTLLEAHTSGPQGRTPPPPCSYPLDTAGSAHLALLMSSHCARLAADVNSTACSKEVIGELDQLTIAGLE